MIGPAGLAVRAQRALGDRGYAHDLVASSRPVKAGSVEHTEVCFGQGRSSRLLDRPPRAAVWARPERSSPL